jgi:hypothetical protein
MVNKQHLLVKRSVDDRASCSVPAASTYDAEWRTHTRESDITMTIYLLRMRREVQVGVFALLRHAM